MKTLRLTAIVVVILTLPLISYAQTTNGPALQINKENRTISVSASDHAEAEPELADINVGFTAYGQTLQTAYKSASETSSTIVQAMISAGATHSDIQSQTQRVTRLQDYEIKLQKGMKYSVQQSWTVSVAPKDAALILDAAIQSGANQSGEITWRMKNTVALEEEAIRRATERARSIAMELAKSMGVTLGKALYATNALEPIRVTQTYTDGFTGGLEARAKLSPAPLSIEAQRVNRTATVQIIFAIE